MNVQEEKKRIEIACCYARTDQVLLTQLKNHLKLWEHQQLIDIWTDNDIGPGMSWREEIKQHLNSAHIILLLVSSDFLASDYCYGTEMTHALNRHKSGKARIIPIILRPCHWEDAPFSDLQALPKDAKPVVLWPNQDEAFTDIAKSIRSVMRDLIPSPIVRPVVPLEADPISRPIPSFRRTRLTRRALIVGIGTMGIAGAGLATFFISNNLMHHDTGTIYKIFSGHIDAIRALAWSPDNQFVATASDDQTTQVWDVSTGQSVSRYSLHTNHVEGVSWSPDGTRIVSGSADGTAQIWESHTGKHINTYRGHITTYQGPTPAQNGPWVNRVQWSRDGAYIASCDQTSDPQRTATVQVWNAETMKTHTVYREHKNGVYSIAWSPDHTRIASVGYDGILRVWNAFSAQTLLTHPGFLDPSRWLFGVAWSPNANYIAYGGTDHKVWVVNATDVNDVSSYLFPYSGNLSSQVDTSDYGVRDIAWSPKGTYIAASSNKHGVHIFNATTKELIYNHVLHLGDLSAIGWASTGNLIASGNGGGASSYVVQIWQAPLE